MFKGNQLLRIPSNVFNTISISSTISVVVSVKEGSEVVTIVSNPSLTPLKTGMSLAVKSDIVLTNGDNENLFNLSSTVKIIGIGGDKIILSSPAIASSYNSESTLMLNLR